MSAPYVMPAAPRRRRRARWPWVLLVIVLVLVGGFVAVDRIALAVAENKAATTLQSSQHLTSKPDVSVAGFPFLTQLVAGQFGEVTITAHGVDVGSGRPLQISSVIVHLHDVTVPRNLSSVRAKTAQADASVGYPELSDGLGLPVHSGGNGRVVAKPSVTVAGQTISATVSAVVHASSADGITFTGARVDGVHVPDVVAGALTKVFSKSISLDGLPFSVRVTGVDARDTGLVLHLAGNNIVYSRN